MQKSRTSAFLTLKSTLYLAFKYKVLGNLARAYVQVHQLKQNDDIFVCHSFYKDILFIMPTGLPYLASPGSIATCLGKMSTAATPNKVTTDFITSKLAIKGGSGRALLPFLKKIGFVNSDGTPSELYVRFRNPAESEASATAAIKIGYKALYEINEYTHALSDEELKGLIVQITGQNSDSKVISLTQKTFQKLKEKADFETQNTDAEELLERPEEADSAKANSPAARVQQPHRVQPSGLGLSYTINLNLPATSDPSVFNAIFKSLKENLLDAHEFK